VGGNNIPVIPRTINDLIESAGLLRIAHDHKATLLASCETALGERNEKISALQAENAKLKKLNSQLVDKSNANTIANARLDEENAKLRKVADAAVPLCVAVGNTQDHMAEWWLLDDVLKEAGYKV